MRKMTIVVLLALLATPATAASINDFENERLIFCTLLLDDLTTALKTYTFFTLVRSASLKALGEKKAKGEKIDPADRSKWQKVLTEQLREQIRPHAAVFRDLGCYTVSNLENRQKK